MQVLNITISKNAEDFNKCVFCFCSVLITQVTRFCVAGSYCSSPIKKGGENETIPKKYSHKVYAYLYDDNDFNDFEKYVFDFVDSL